MIVAEPGEKYWFVLEPHFEKVSIYEGGVVFLRQFQSLPPGIGTLLAAHWLDSEVCNGGFHQFFSNPTGVLAPEALTAFQDLGLDDAAALRFFGSPYPRGQEARQAMLQAVAGEAREEWDPFFALDDRYYTSLPAGSCRLALAADAWAETHG